MSIKFVLLAFLAALLVSCNSASAAIVPTGLSPGDRYRLAFVSRDTRDAVSPNVADYNSFVDDQASLAGSLTENIDTVWKAIVSTPSISAKQTTGTDDTPVGANGVPIFTIDGSRRIADNYDDLWDGTIDSPISLDQFGDTMTTIGVWTGTWETGIALNPAFAIGGSSTDTIIGSSGVSTFQWVRTVSVNKTSQRRLYGISGELTVVPEPSTAFFLLVFYVTGPSLLGSRKLSHF